ncbi:helix-turn-helix domain-containing protein [Pontibacillus sp. HN14]|nr:helix-turn-helix domain-containing protein [Pontibacillus sp. HN14]
MIGQKLKYLRQREKLTQGELAEKLNISRGTYAHYELGKRNPDYETLNKIANFYNVSTDFILGRSYAESSEVKDAFDPLEELKQYLIDNNMQDMDLSFYDLNSWKDLTREDIEEIKNHFEWVREKAKKRKDD